MMIEWISVNERLPRNGVNVLATYKNDYGKTRFVVARYLERWREESQYDECNDEYNEDDGMYYLCKGWYESLDNWGEYSSIVIHEGQVSHWAEIAAPIEETAVTARGE